MVVGHYDANNDKDDHMTICEDDNNKDDDNNDNDNGSDDNDTDLIDDCDTNDDLNGE